MEDSHFNSSYFWSPVSTGQIENAVFINKKDQFVPLDKAGSFAPPSAACHYPTAVLTMQGSAVTMETSRGGGKPQESGGHLHPPPTSQQNITVVPVPSTGIMTAADYPEYITSPAVQCLSARVHNTTVQYYTTAGLVITTPQGTIVSSSPPGSVAGQSFSVSGVTGHPSAATMIVSALHPSPDTPPPAGEKPKPPPSSSQPPPHPSPSSSHAHPSPPALHTPGKRGRKKKQPGGAGINRTVMPAHSAITGGNQAMILAHLAAGGQHHSSDPYDLGNEDEETITAKDGSRSYRCRMCAVTFFSKSEMQLHSKTHTENKPHKCLHCSKTFANSSYLAQHIRIHSGAKPYTCSYCQKAYRQLSHLQQHTRIHTGDRPYKCAHPGCEKAFTQLSNLQSHRRQHNKDKPYKCHHCHRAYTDSASLEVHLSTHTVKHAKVYSCGMCNRAYTSETYLMKHMRKHNPDPSNPVQQNQSAQSSSSQQNQPHYTNQSEPIPGQCPFDLHQYKPVSSTELQYKPVQNQSDHQQHKDLCLTVSTSAIQVVEHLNS
ncbi:zinc finger protein 362-like isoform X1 [Acipenser ruthenus]|uniref:zinc finger protein 362-like isoform X1 n=1 Tax=Acipenser ruthenus TaxID=7906 RepID=UPI00155FF250|nr:zinc finger protein 362-like isoform X1 [Acipenser ruthenus]XP_058848493.1 zinc finger protein 362-like isoform X1 [Acipenser ruthenus]XP_058848494.1 zinc finger protein 362-like isoform X1 [Acipenser ruthenus]